MVFNEEDSKLLADEMRELQDTTSIQVNLFNSQTQELIGQSIIEIWIMVENSSHILRQVCNNILLFFTLYYVSLSHSLYYRKFQFLLMT
jgi:hypothetical protein